RVSALAAFDPEAFNQLLGRLKQDAESFVRAGTQGDIRCEITAYMRYAGQGWEIPVALPDQAYTEDDAVMIRAVFEARYTQFFGRTIDGPEIEFVTFSV